MWNGGFMSRVMTGAVARRRIVVLFPSVCLEGVFLDVVSQKELVLAIFFGGVFMIIYHIHYIIFAYFHYMLTTVNTKI